MSKTAFSCWNGRIAPLFDTATGLRVIESQNGQILHQTDVSLPEGPLEQRARQLAELGIQTLVCGAISRPLIVLVQAYGIGIVSFVAGDLRDVSTAWLAGRLRGPQFAMPGCARPGFGLRSQGRTPAEGMQMTGNGRGRGGGRGMGGGMGGRRGQGPGCRAGFQISETGSECVCPTCGHREAHELGMPCVQKQCPKCGTPLARG